MFSPASFNDRRYALRSLWHYRRVNLAVALGIVAATAVLTGALIVGDEGIKNAYATGRGRITMRAVTHIEEMRGNRHRVVVTELPYQVNKANLIERIATLVRDDKVQDIADLRDESDRRGMSIIIELKRGAQPRQVLNQLFKYTQLQTTFGYNCLALIDGTPRTLSLKEMLKLGAELAEEAGLILPERMWDADSPHAASKVATAKKLAAIEKLKKGIIPIEQVLAESA